MFLPLILDYQLKWRTPRGEFCLLRMPGFGTTWFPYFSHSLRCGFQMNFGYED